MWLQPYFVRKQRESITQDAAEHLARGEALHAEPDTAAADELPE